MKFVVFAIIMMYVLAAVLFVKWLKERREILAERKRRRNRKAVLDMWYNSGSMF